MPTKEEILRDQTFKGDVDELDKRIYYTLTSKPELAVRASFPKS